LSYKKILVVPWFCSKQDRLSNLLKLYDKSWPNRP